jgi:hypothetical protein
VNFKHFRTVAIGRRQPLIACTNEAADQVRYRG